MKPQYYDDQGKEMRDAVKTIEDRLKYSENLKDWSYWLLHLCITNKIIWMLNMMLLNDKKRLW